MSRPRTRKTIETDLGTEVQCTKCEEFWPSDPEFFFFSGGRPHSWCKACYAADPKVQARRVRASEKVSCQRRLAREDSA